MPIVRMAEEVVKDKGLRFLTHDKIPNGDEGISIGFSFYILLFLFRISNIGERRRKF